VEWAWQLWADPRQLERWWGPPAYPATVLAADSPHGLEVQDGFGDADGKPDPDMPSMTISFTLEESSGGPG